MFLGDYKVIGFLVLVLTLSSHSVFGISSFEEVRNLMADERNGCELVGDPILVRSTYNLCVMSVACEKPKNKVLRFVCPSNDDNESCPTKEVCLTRGEKFEKKAKLVLAKRAAPKNSSDRTFGEHCGSKWAPSVVCMDPEEPDKAFCITDVNECDDVPNAVANFPLVACKANLPEDKAAPIFCPTTRDCLKKPWHDAKLADIKQAKASSTDGKVVPHSATNNEAVARIFSRTVPAFH